MIKFLVIIFLFQGSTQFKYIGQKEVASAEECLKIVLEINTAQDNPYNAACIVNKIQ
jgi:hypothetical protein